MTRIQLQFKFGETRQLHYKLGDRITWGGSTLDLGKSVWAKVLVYGILENADCTCWRKDNEQFDILVMNDVIISVQPMETYQRYFESEWDDSGSYVVIEP